MSVAVVQLALFNIGLAYPVLHIVPNEPHTPIAELAWLDQVDEVDAARRPPRIPGRSKGQKGLAIREAAAVKPKARLL